MLVRFTIARLDQDSRCQQGLFHAAESLRAGKLLADHEEITVREAFDWFNRWLPHPTRFARSRRAHARNQAVSWFKDTAVTFIARMEDLAVVLVEHGHIVQRHATSRPGYIVNEDAYQVVAEPFRGE
jgi:hypothetical protein